jgi:integrase
MAGYIRELSGRFYIRTRVRVIDPETGEARWKFVEKAAGTSKRQAQRALKDLQGEVEAGAYIPTNLTVLQLGQKWLREHVQPNLKPGAAMNYKGTFYKHVAPTLGPLRLDDCRPEHVRALLARKRESGVSEPTVTKIRSQLHAMFAFGIDEHLLNVNPADTPRRRGPKQSRRARGTALTPMQIDRFLRECSPRWRAFFTVALDTGLRRGELIGLRWGDVDLLERMIFVRRSIGAYDDPEQASTKTEAGERVVPILDGAQAALEQLYREAKDTGDEAPVFASVQRRRDRGGVVGRSLSPRMVSGVFKRYAERAGIPDTVRLHDLRHTAITNAINQGEDILLVSAFAGHAQTSTTVDVYSHLMPERVRQAAKRMRSVVPAEMSDAVSDGSRRD